jgi:hypothetical protein
MAEQVKGIDVKLERSDAIELHAALAPKEARGAPYLQFLVSLGLSAILGLLVGSLIDNAVEWGQGNDPNPNRGSCATWFFVQIWANITVLFIFNQIFQWGFVPWLLITLAGFLFTLTLVNVQNSLTSNATCLFKF